MESPVILTIENQVLDDPGLKEKIESLIPGCSLYASNRLIDGLEIAGKINPDLVIANVQVSDISPVDFCNRFKSQEKTAYIPLILASFSKLPSSTIAECLTYGARDFVSLPMGDEEFVARVRAAINSSSSAYGINHSGAHHQKPTPGKGTSPFVEEMRLSEFEDEHRRLIMAIEQVEESILITDSEANIHYVNPAFEKITGYSREEVIGRNPRFLKSGAHSGTFYRKMWQTLSSGKVWKGNLINKQKDSTLYNEEVTISPVINDQGVITNYIGVKRDVTQQMALEQQLRQSQKMEAIGTLAGGIAHDFNNILFAIIGYNTLSQRILGTDHPVYEHLQKLGSAAERAKELVTQILTFSRQSEQTFKPLLIQPVVKEALNLMRATIPSTIEVIQTIDLEGGLVNGDLTQVHQIIVNLATNAYQAMKDKGGVLSVSLTSVFKDPDKDSRFQGLAAGKYIELIVSDTGEGIDDRDIDRIFEPYFSTRQIGEGTGLGLSIVHGIVSLYKGQIFVESSKTKGTTFFVYLPELDAEEEPRGQEAESTENDLTGSGHIVVLDDEKHITKMLKQMLGDLGYTVSAFTDSLAALESFQANSEQYDLLITDMTMPKMTGAELSTRLLKIKPELPIVLCTGYSEKINEQVARELGIREYVMKPVSFKTLAKIVKKNLC